jgi:hypothetical protein
MPDPKDPSRIVTTTTTTTFSMAKEMARVDTLRSELEEGALEREDQERFAVDRFNEARIDKPLAEEAINNLGSLKFSQSNRMPDPKDPSRIVTTTTSWKRAPLSGKIKSALPSTDSMKRASTNRWQTDRASEEAINNLGSLKFSQSNRMPDPKDPSRIVTTTTAGC